MSNLYRKEKMMRQKRSQQMTPAEMQQRKFALNLFRNEHGVQVSGEQPDAHPTENGGSYGKNGEI